MDERFVKITDAVLKLIEFFPEQEIAKTKIKERILQAMEKIAIVFAADGWASLQKDKVAGELYCDIEIILSYLNLAKERGWISSINFLILSKEYEDVQKRIKLPRGITRELLKVATENETEKCGVSETPQTEKLDERQLNERQKKILGMLKEKEKVQVADIVRVLPNITKRTIRRDMDDLIKRGQVMREGEWNQAAYKLVV